MKKFALISAMAMIVINPAFAASIQAVREGAPVVSQHGGHAVYTQIEYSVRVTSVQSDSQGPDLTKKYVLLSNGLVTAPTLTSPCQVMQIGQVAMYQGQLGHVLIAVMPPASNQNADCSPVVQQLIDTNPIKVKFRTALLGDGSGSDVAPVGLTIGAPTS